MESVNQRREDLVIRMFFSIILFITTYMLIIKYFEAVASDFPYHAKIADGFHFSNLKQEIESGNTYFMWSAMAGLLHRRGNVSLEGACAVITALANVATLNVVMDYIKRKIPKIDQVTWIYLGAGLFFVGPLFFPWINSYYYLGTWSPNPWHNPTNNMVRPFAMLSMVLILNILEKEEINWKEHVFLSVILALSVLAKPSFLQGIAPALVLYVLADTIASRKIRFRKYLLLASAFIPAGCILIYQLWLTFYSGNTRSEGIGFASFEIIKLYAENVWVSLLACIAFPLFVIITAVVLQRKNIFKNARVILMVCYLFAGWFEMAFLYEKGSRVRHGNFAWGYMMAVFIAYALSVVEFLEIIRSDFKHKELIEKIGIGLYTLHLLFGIWYICMMPQHDYLLY